MDSAPEHCLKKANGFHASSIHEMREYRLDAFFSPRFSAREGFLPLLFWGALVSNHSGSFVLSVNNGCFQRLKL